MHDDIATAEDGDGYANVQHGLFQSCPEPSGYCRCPIVVGGIFCYWLIIRKGIDDFLRR